VENSLAKISQDLFTALGDDALCKNTAIGKAIEISLLLSGNGKSIFRNKLQEFIFQALEAGEPRNLLLEILFHEGNPTKAHEKDMGKGLPIIIDVENWRDYLYPVASEKMTEWVNQKLLDNLRKNETLTEQKGYLDAFGMEMGNTKGPMPQVLINNKQISLRTMFDDHSCQYRYQKIKDSSFPVSAKNRRRLAGATNYIASPEQRGVTWDTLTKNEILFSFPNKLPEKPISWTNVFVSTDNHSRFKDMAKKFTSSLRGIPLESKPEFISIFILKKTDDNAASKRGRIIFTHNTTPEKISQAAGDWSNGCNNFPMLDFSTQFTPFPLRTADVINAVWKQDGSRADGNKPVERMKYYQGMELFLDILSQSAIDNFLHILLQNSSGLIYHLGNQMHRGKEKNKNTGEIIENKKLKVLKKSGAPVFSMLGLLLHKSQKRKESYMEEFAFLFGQLLHISDDLHTLYCKVKRNGDIPPQLVGSALFITAGEMPYRAIAQLSVRMNPYISWAKQYQYQDRNEEYKESWRAKWLLGLYEKLMDKIKPAMDQEVRLNDYEKAQLFIGFMASLPKLKGANELTTNIEYIEQGESNDE
jgi:hypothetical protein